MAKEKQLHVSKVEYTYSKEAKKFVEKVYYDNGMFSIDYIRSPTRRLREMLWQHKIEVKL
jgi:hypothetical protein